MRILVSGFVPFDGLSVNVSKEVVELLPSTLENHEIFKVILPVSFEKSFSLLQAEVERVKPDVVLALGLAVNRQEITVERVALNIMDARTPDNDGFKPVDLPVVGGGEAGLFATLPIKEMVAACAAAGVSASVSNSAGTYVCNQVMYKLLYALRESHVRSGFIHLPSRPAAELLPGLIAMLKALV